MARGQRKPERRPAPVGMDPFIYRVWRSRMGFTHQEAAEAISVSHRTSVGYERGEAPIRPPLAFYIRHLERLRFGSVIA